MAAIPILAVAIEYLYSNGHSRKGGVVRLGVLCELGCWFIAGAVYMMMREGDSSTYKMIASLQKRRNQSTESPYDNKFYLKRTHGNSALLPHSPSPLLPHPPTPLKDRLPNRTLIPSETDDNLLRKRPPPRIPPQRYNNQLAVLEDRFSLFASKIKTLLRTDHEDGKENALTNSTIINANSNNPASMARSALLLKKAEQQVRQTQERQCSGESPYFIECLRRKTNITTEACMHIHTSILTFKQYLKSVQLAKPKTPDPRYALQLQGRKTIVFDMDQTLIHTNEAMVKGWELKVPFKSIQGKVISGYVHIRPHARQIIRNLSRHFDVLVFTAGNQCYADPILDALDPQRLIKHRLYRDSCTMLNSQLFVKDLRILGRPLQSVVLVDNAPYSYMMQLGNGIPILNYLRGKEDDQLVRLEEYLMGLLEVADVRTVNSDTFRLKDYLHYDNYEQLIYGLYSKWL